MNQHIVGHFFGGHHENTGERRAIKEGDRWQERHSPDGQHGVWKNLLYAHSRRCGVVKFR